MYSETQKLWFAIAFFYYLFIYTRIFLWISTSVRQNSKKGGKFRFIRWSNVINTYCKIKSFDRTRCHLWVLRLLSLNKNTLEAKTVCILKIGGPQLISKRSEENSNVSSLWLKSDEVELNSSDSDELSKAFYIPFLLVQKRDESIRSLRYSSFRIGDLMRSARY